MDNYVVVALLISLGGLILAIYYYRNKEQEIEDLQEDKYQLHIQLEDYARLVRNKDDLLSQRSIQIDKLENVIVVLEYRIDKYNLNNMYNTLVGLHVSEILDSPMTTQQILNMLITDGTTHKSINVMNQVLERNGYVKLRKRIEGIRASRWYLGQ